MCKEAQLIRCVKDAGGIAPDALAEHLGIKPRTVRCRIKQANESLGGIANVTYDRATQLYRLDINDETALEQWLATCGGACGAQAPDSPRERAAYLLNDLLMRTDWITLDELSSALYVSRACVSNALVDAEKELSRFDLTIKRRPHYGIKVEGSELNRRICMADVVLDGLRHSSGFGGEELLPDLSAVAASVERALADSGFQINPVVYQNLLVHVAIAIARIRSGANMTANPACAGRLSGANALQAAHAIAGCLSTDFDVELPEEEVTYIAIHLAGKQVIPDLEGIGPQGDSSEPSVIPDEAWQVVADMLECVRRTSHFDFRDDIELRMNLVKHVVPLSVRLRYRMHIENPLLSDIKTRYPLAYAMASDASTVLTERYGSTPSEHEVGYIALSFALALERKRTEMPKKNILIVCASGVGSARLLAYRYRQDFNATVGEIQTCDVSRVGEVDFSSIDYAFTTVPLNHELPVPTCQVSCFLDGEDMAHVREFLTLGDYRASEGIASCFDAKLFYADVPGGTKSEVLEAMCQKARRTLDITEDLASLVQEREDAAVTSIGNGVAIPHPMHPVTDRTVVAIGIPHHPVDWGVSQVKAVFLILVSKGAHDNLEEFYMSLFDVLNSERIISDLALNRDFDRFLASVQSAGDNGTPR